MRKITDEQHRQIGAILGYPSCCVEAWIADRYGAAIRRGAIVERKRSESEIAELEEKISAFLGWNWPLRLVESVKQYVPCEKCSIKRG